MAHRVPASTICASLQSHTMQSTVGERMSGKKLLWITGFWPLLIHWLASRSALHNNFIRSRMPQSPYKSVKTPLWFHPQTSARTHQINDSARSFIIGVLCAAREQVSVSMVRYKRTFMKMKPLNKALSMTCGQNGECDEFARSIHISAPKSQRRSRVPEHKLSLIRFWRGLTAIGESAKQSIPSLLREFHRVCQLRHGR